VSLLSVSHSHLCKQDWAVADRYVRHLLRFAPLRCRPDRWFDLEADKHAPPLKTWSFMMGPRTCPGWRYAQVQVMW
jgi:hypothetical protein